MKIHIVSNDGELLDTIEDIEEYDLNSQMARISLANDIEAIIVAAEKRGIVK